VTVATILAEPAISKAINAMMFQVVVTLTPTVVLTLVSSVKTMPVLLSLIVVLSTYNVVVVKFVMHLISVHLTQILTAVLSMKIVVLAVVAQTVSMEPRVV